MFFRGANDGSLCVAYKLWCVLSNFLMLLIYVHTLAFAEYQ